MQTKRITTRDCEDCALKHLSSCVVVMSEMLNGYQKTDHDVFLMGNMVQAEEHLASVNPKLSNKIRNIRIDIFDNDWFVKAEHLKLMRELYVELRSLLGYELMAEKIKTLPEILPNGRTVRVRKRKPCGGCTKKS